MFRHIKLRQMFRDILVYNVKPLDKSLSWWNWSFVVLLWYIFMSCWLSDRRLLQTGSSAPLPLLSSSD